MDNEYWINKIRVEVIPVVQQSINPQKVLLFGSRARGNSNPDSDIDIIIVSDFFRDIHPLKRMTLVLKRIRFPKHIDVLCYTPEEFETIRKTSAIVMDAVNNSYVLA